MPLLQPLLCAHRCARDLQLDNVLRFGAFKKACGAALSLLGEHISGLPRLSHLHSLLPMLPAAGGRMIGKSVSNAVLDGWTGAFYEWEGDVKVGKQPECRPCLVPCTKTKPPLPLPVFCIHLPHCVHNPLCAVACLSVLVMA